MQLENQTDHIAILALMMVGVLVRRLQQVGQLDETTSRQLLQLVDGVRKHAKLSGITDLHILFDNLDSSLRERGPQTV